MKNQTGITLISLVITIIVMLILASIGTVAGLQSIEMSRKTAFITELELIQSRVNTIYEKRKLNQEDKTYYDNLGQDISKVDQTKLQTILGEVSKEGFRYFSREDLKKIDLDNITQDVLINYDTRAVYSYTGIKIDDHMYYHLKDMPQYSGYQIEYNNINNQAPTFSADYIKEGDGWRVTISDIIYTSNVNAGTLSHKFHTQTNWILDGETTSFKVNHPGQYDIQLTDKAGNSTIIQKFINYDYITDGLLAYYDGENNTGDSHSSTATTWKDLSGNNKDAIFQGTNLNWQDNYYYFNNPQTDYFITENSIIIGDSSRTIEYVLNMDTENTQTFFGMGTSSIGSMMDAMYSNGEFVIHNYGNSLVGLPIVRENKTYYNSWRYENSVSDFKVNSTQKNDVAFLTLNTTNTPLQIGRGVTYNNNNAFKIYAIRIYDRKLTDEEMAKNYEIDKQRFSIIDTQAKVGYIDDFETFNYSSSGTQVNSCSNSILNIISTNVDPIIYMYNMTEFDPKEYRYIEIKYRTTTNDSMEFFMIENPNSQTYSIYKKGLYKDGEWHIATVDLWSNQEVKNRDKITGWRFDWGGDSKADVSMEIDYIRVVSSID